MSNSPNTNSPIKKLVILGGGSAGWMAAAALANAFDKSIEILLVESDAIGTVGVGEATIPLIRAFNSLLGIDEAEFLAYTQGTFKLGIHFENWGAIGESYMHPFGLVGKDSWMANFQHFWLRAQRLGIARSYWDYSLNIRAAYANKFAPDRASGLEYAYHFDAGRYAQFLRRYAEQRGVKRREGKIAQVKLNSDSGFIETLQLETGEQIHGDFFIDCSGFSSLLIEKALHTGFEDWSHWLPCDRALAVQTQSHQPASPYTRSIAQSAGWRWQIPLQHRVGNGLVYASRHMDDDQAQQLLLQQIQGEPITEPRLIRFRTGRAIKQWQRNCVAIGLAGGFLEPLESTSLHLIQSAVTRLIRMFPAGGICTAEVDEFNRQAKAEYDYIRDFIILHYHVTRRDDSEFWNQCRTMDIPDSLAQKIEIYKASCSVFREHQDLFHEGSWQQVMHGQGITPSNYHPVVDKLSDGELSHFVLGIDEKIGQLVNGYPNHMEFVARNCAAKP